MGSRYFLLFLLVISGFGKALGNDRKLSIPDDVLDNPPVMGSISGIVIDELTNEPLPYVNVVVRDLNDSLITGGITDDKGQFDIQALPEGSSKVEIQYIGYETKVTRVDVSRNNNIHQLKTITLRESSELLEEVVVRGELTSVTQKIDRKVINVGKDLTATGTSASELLNNVQSVSVDPESGAISLRGNENVKILVDGKPTNVSASQLLKQIPSSSIKSIELITNPSAKYNPEGMSGIINIVLYKNATLGLNGNINGGLTYGRNLRYNGALDVNYRKGRVNLFANYGYNGGKSDGGGELHRLDINSLQEGKSENLRSSHLLKVGADVYLNESNTISIFTTQNLYLAQRSELLEVYFEDVPGSENLKENEDENYTGSYNLSYTRDFQKEGHNLVFDASLSNSDSWDQISFINYLDLSDPTSNFLEDIRNQSTRTVLNLDYTNPLGENVKLEMGLEARFHLADNQYDTDRQQFAYDSSMTLIPDGEGGFVTYPVGNSGFKYEREIYSAYANYGHKFGKLSLQAGVRLEYYDARGEFTENEASEEYVDQRVTAYPSAFLTYTPSQKNQFQFSYSRRVDRPGISQINPLRTSWSSPLLTWKGNPGLVPQFTNSIEFNYSRTFKKGSLSSGIFYRRISDPIIRYGEDADPLEPGKLVITFTNGEGTGRYGFEMSGMYRPTSWWNINASLDLYQQVQEGIAFGEYIEVQSYSSNIRMNNTFTATDNLSFQLFGMYRGTMEFVQWKRLPMGMVNAGVSYKVFNKKGTISLNVRDIFNTMRFRMEWTNYYPGNGSFYWENRTVFVGYTQHFGQGENKARRLKNRENREMSGGEGGF